MAENYRYDLRCIACGRFIDFGDPDARCKEIRSMDVLGNVDEREECLCGKCSRSEVSHGPSPTGEAAAARRSVDSATSAVDRHRPAAARIDAILINLSDWDHKCVLCGSWGRIDHCVPFYEDPRPDLEIGQILPNGDAVGGMSCCKRCFDRLTVDEMEAKL